MNIDAIIKDKVITQLNLNYDESREYIIDTLIEDYILIAQNIAHRNDEKIIPYVKNAVIEAYIRLGLEGVETSNVGGVSNKFVDVEDKLIKDVKKVRKMI